MEYKKISIDYKDRSGYACGFEAENTTEDIQCNLQYTINRLQHRYGFDDMEIIEEAEMVKDFDGLEEILKKLPIRKLVIKKYNKYIIEGGKLELILSLEEDGYKPDFENFINDILYFMEFEEGKDLYEEINNAYDGVGFDDCKRLEAIFDVLKQNGYTISNF